jgi:hypothetical protein
MCPTRSHAEVEARFRDLLIDNELAFPDEIEYRPGEVVFLWTDRKVAIVVELDSPASAA